MKKWICLLAILISLFGFRGQKSISPDWISLFVGHWLNGYKVSENAGSFSVKDGQIMVNGHPAHLVYVGDYKTHDFKNFELRVEVLTHPGPNSGLYFHTQYQESIWPKTGFEVQANNSQESVF